MCPLLPKTGQARERLRVLCLYQLFELVRFDRFGGLGGGPLVHAARPLEDALHAPGIGTTPEVIDLAHRRELVVLLPAPDELAHTLYRRRVLWDELYSHPVAYVAAVRPTQMLGGVLDLHLHHRRVEREVNGYTRRNLLH